MLHELCCISARSSLLATKGEQGSYRQVCVTFKDFSTFLLFSRTENL